MTATDSAERASLIAAARSLAPQIRACRDEIEQSRRLPASLVTALAEAGLFRLYLPKSLGGLEVDPVTFLHVVEEVARIDGAVGWNVAIGTLMHERATLGAGMQITFRRQFDRLVELSHSVQRDGRPAASDPVMRQKLAQSFVDIEIMRLNQMRAITRINQNGVPGPEGSIQKIFWTELNQRFQQVAAELLGPYVQLTRGDGYAIDDGAWAYSFLRARGNTIEAGTSEIQRNIVARRVLNLPQ